MPGFGLSDPTDFVPKVEDYARVVPSVLDHLGIKSAVVLGHQKGALVATEVALQFEAGVVALILNGPVPLTEQAKQEGLDYVENFEKQFAAQSDGQHLVTLFQRRMSTANESTKWELSNRYIAEHFIGYAPFGIATMPPFNTTTRPSFRRSNSPHSFSRTQVMKFMKTRSRPQRCVPTLRTRKSKGGLGI